MRSIFRFLRATLVVLVMFLVTTMRCFNVTDHGFV